MPVSGRISYSPRNQCFNPGDTVVFTGHARRTPRSDGRANDPDGPDEDDGPAKDVSSEIVWRSTGQGNGARWTHVIEESDLEHKTFDAYVSGHPIASVTLTINPVCKIFQEYTEDQVRLAALLFIEGNTDGGGADEQRSQAYVVANRVRYQIAPGNGRGFGSTVKEVIEKKGRDGKYEFRALGEHPELYDELTDPKKRKCTTAKRCSELVAQLAELLKIAKEVLEDPTGIGDPIRKQTNQPAFFFNKSKQAPAGKKSPLLRAKGEGGWTHSFWGSTVMNPPGVSPPPRT